MENWILNGWGADCPNCVNCVLPEGCQHDYDEEFGCEEEFIPVKVIA